MWSAFGPINIRTLRSASARRWIWLSTCCVARRLPSRYLGKFAEIDLRRVTFYSYGSIRELSSPTNASHQSKKDLRKLKLGKTVRILHDRLPNLLVTPLPSDILSPNISLHLFPSTHPHLPTVTGRIAYTGALWTAPVAWGRLPVLGNVKIDIVSQRMVFSGPCKDDDEASERLIVKWKTCTPVDHTAKESTSHQYSGSIMAPVDKLTELLRGEIPAKSKPFHGLFIFEFDDQGRVLKHTIDHVEESRDLDQMPKVVSVTDWLLGRAPWNRKNEGVPELAWCKLLRPLTDCGHGDTT